MKPSMLYDYCKTQKFITILLSIASKLEIFKGPNWILYAALCNQMLVQAFGKLRIFNFCKSFFNCNRYSRSNFNWMFVILYGVFLSCSLVWTVLSFNQPISQSKHRTFVIILFLIYTVTEGRDEDNREHMPTCIY